MNDMGVWRRYLGVKMKLCRKCAPNKIGRPLDGKEVKLTEGFRLEPWKKKILIKKFGTFQAAMDAVIDEGLGLMRKIRKKANRKTTIPREKIKQAVRAVRGDYAE